MSTPKAVISSNSRIWLAYASGFFADLAVMVGLTVTPFFVFNQLHGGAALSGVFASGQAAAYAGTCLLSSLLVSRVKNGLILAKVGIAFFALFYAFMPFSTSTFSAWLASVLANAALGLYWPAMYSWLGAHPDPQQRARRLAYFNVAWSLGFSISPLLAGPLYDLDFRYPFALLVGTCACVLVFLQFLPKERYMPSEETHADALDHVQESERLLYAAWAAIFCANWIMAVLRSIYPKHVQDLVLAGRVTLLHNVPLPSVFAQAPATTFSWLAVAASLCTALTFFVLGHTERWKYRIHVLLYGLLIATVGSVLLARTHSLVWMLTAFALCGTNLGLAFFASSYYSVANPRRKHSRAAVSEGLVGLGGVVGSLSFGMIYETHGNEITLWALSGLCVISAALVYGLYWIRRRASSE
jgi:MFS family permease